jgi:hypothetical protein
MALGFAAFGHVVDEGAVDLDFVEGQPLDVAERGVAGAEVVDGQADAEGLDLAEQRQALFGLRHQHGFGDFDDELPGFDAAFGKGVLEGVEEAGPFDLRRGDVDRDGQAGVPGALPGGELPAGFADGPVAEFDDQAGFFGDGDEAAGHEQAEAGVAPAHEGFEADDAGVVETSYLRLVVAGRVP